jgi:hypothetical protein
MKLKCDDHVTVRQSGFPENPIRSESELDLVFLPLIRKNKIKRAAKRKEKQSRQQ